MKKTQLVDIAKALNVSKTLVSLVLNNKGDDNGISKATQKKVIEKAKELNYTPNNFARGLRIGKSNTLGLIVSDISNPFYSKLARTVENFAYSSNYNLIICSSDEKPEKEEKLINILLNKNVDGLIISSTLYSPDIFFELKERNFPFVLIDRHFNNDEFNYVGVDNIEGSFEGTSILAKHGYQNIGFVTLGPQHISSLNDRLEGYKLALKNNNQKIDNSLIKYLPFEFTENHLKKAINDLMDQKADSIFFANNTLALKSLSIFKELNIKVPEEIAVISFDDTDVFKYTQTPISAIKQPIEKICMYSFEILYKNIQKTNSKVVHKELSTEVIVRESIKQLNK